ncbi:MAG: RNA polymerase sigma factor [Nitratireductor sp.]
MVMRNGALAEKREAEPAETCDLQALAVLASNGDRLAFAQLVAVQYDFIFRTAWRWTRHREMAEDVAQGVCMKLGQSIRNWRGEGAFSTWLYRLVVNAANDAHRARQRENRKTEGYLNYAVSAAIEVVEPHSDSPTDELWEHVSQLPEKQRTAVMLVYGEGLSHGEAAGVMEIAESTVSFHLHEARKQLKAMFEKERAR